MMVYGHLVRLLLGFVRIVVTPFTRLSLVVSTPDAAKTLGALPCVFRHPRSLAFP